MPEVDFLGFDHTLLYFLGALVLVEIFALVFLYHLRTSKGERKQGGVNLGAVKLIRPVGQEGVLREITRLREGQDLDESVVRCLSAEDKALFEVALIDTLTELPREQQHRLRATLVKHGYDEQCSRGVMRGEISDRVRASALLDLLRPQSRLRAFEFKGSGLEGASHNVRAAGGRGGSA